ncbi:PR domain zinc finger protein 10-like isoform X1 [Corythoichthys intestinalis]|uniref:PR domain zinc finger protein 10-like isoform X1 n=1 Tax=Corythoichthys intestinalis TaxID=161448 RepID=UPI0025A58279|nr:PR domain zinc finger protein 10-like isoform X1 [Corythoichthys intestinalis]XP_057695885.1 PR domain zinc finger protein 10-like isoform X1 [Corythoichthys intestinalis]XP_057695887.1 PR domain zinc finger protein 10-like isoform X1 [Corythoichthys intestinalis]XP_057695888.1 PR domain zinc finger protein 10-like isoform X1 [Corythoichthys intestinalis]XP_057695889.1 PR domain zinc finger protein 10-like isoform X1 [Corythoichthys intestinalis]
MSTLTGVNMENKPESATVWNQSENTDSADAPQVHFEGGTVAQLVYSGDSTDPAARGQQQRVVYAADGSSYTSVESAEHTLVYIHPADGTQAVFADQPQVAYIQQDGTTQQVAVLLPSGQNVNTASLHVLSNVAEAPQATLEPAPQEQLPDSNSQASMADMTDPPSSPLGAMDTTDDSEEDDDDEEDSDIDDWEPRQRFNPHNLWCEECNNSNTSDCLTHGPLHPIPNRPVMSKARASLPLVLYIDRFLGGVFSKRFIPKRTQFGPVDGPLVPQSALQDNYIHLKLCILDAEKDGEKSQDTWLDLSDEESCNWMMFVRPAQNHLEQNLVAYQYGPDIFYTTIKNIEPKQELKVWYAATYAEFVNQKLHSVTEEERKVLRELEKNWPCYECSRRFVSSEQLQQHLNMHDNMIQSVSRSKGRGRARGRKRFGTSRRPGRPPKFIRLDAPVEDEVDKTTEMLDLSEAQPLDEPMEAAQNGVEVTVSEPDTEAEGQTAPPAIEPSVTPPSNPDPPPPAKEELAQDEQSEAHLLSPDVRRLKRMRNATLQHHFIRKSFRPFKCKHCDKAFRDKDKLEQHLRVHGRDSFVFPCHLCSKTFVTDTALDDHLLVHNENRTYPCLLCTETFDRPEALRDHLDVHAVDGNFTCPSCKKTFPDFIQVKKHIRCFHSEKIFQCPNCEKAFCRPDKLRLHMLRHSDRRDFLCSTCGKQFKRKDKLREHMQRMHNPEREAKKAERSHRAKSCKMKPPTTDFESFMFKCRLCMMGFRRRGMLVNHLSKRHPEMRINDVPELTLPIIKPNRDYYCQYCDKVYKSASKRKTHILKNHPGAELPPSIRKLPPAAPGGPDPMLTTHTQLAGTIAFAPVCCPHCAKQYSSKTKMVQHIRKKHPEFAQLINTIQAPLPATVISSTPAVISTDGATAEAVVTTDLLTQAMTELSQTLTTDYRTSQGDYQRIQYIPVSQAGGSLSQPQHIQLQVVQVAPAPSPHSQQQTVDVNQLHDPHGYSQHSIQVQHIQVTEPSASGQDATQVTGQPLSPNSQQTNQELSPTQLAPVTLAPNQNLQSGGTAGQQQQQQQGAVQHAYLPGNWNYRGYPSEIQMMTLPQAQYVIAEATTPVTGADSNQVKTRHYVISEGQTELDPNKPSGPASSNPGEHLEPPASQQATTQYIITTTTNGSGTSEVHITKP